MAWQPHEATSRKYGPPIAIGMVHCLYPLNAGLSTLAPLQMLQEQQTYLQYPFAAGPRLAQPAPEVRSHDSHVDSIFAHMTTHDRQAVLGHIMESKEQEQQMAGPLSPMPSPWGQVQFHGPPPPSESADEGPRDGGRSDEAVDATVDTEASSAALKTQFELHTQGLCRPCNFNFLKEDGCRHGDACQFCHICTKKDRHLRRRGKRVAQTF